MSSNYPPGVSGNEREIVGDTWELVHERIDTDATREGMTDMDVAVTWALGLAAWKAAHKMGAKFPHE